MALISPFGLGTAGDVWKMNQQAIVNQQNQQRINDLLANDALKRQVQQQQLQDYLTGTRGAGAYFRGLAGQQAPSIGTVSAPAQAPAPGQNSAQSAAPASPTPVDVPGASTAQFTPGGGFSNVTTPQQVQRGMELGVIPWQQGAAIVRDMQARGNMPAQGSASVAPAPPSAPAQQAPQASSGDLPTGTYGRVLALAQSNQVINLASRAAAQLLKTNPNMSDRQLDLAMQQIYPALSEQSKNMLQLAGLSNTQMFRAVGMYLRAQAQAARYPGAAGANPYTPEQVQNAIGMIRAGQIAQVPQGLRIAAISADPSLGAEAQAGKAQQAAATAGAVAPVKVKQAADTATATAMPKATGSALTQVQKNLSAIEPAYQALDANFAGLVNAAKQYGLGPATPINSLLNRMRKMGDPNYTNYEIFLKGVQKEFGKVLQGATGARGVSVSAMKDAEGTLSPNMTLGQLEAAQKALMTEGGNVLNSLRTQKQSLTQQLQGGGQAPTQQFQNGAIYTDANGNKARYENGQWTPVQ